MEIVGRVRKLVAAALVTEGSRVLIARRRDDQPHPGLWELPGGKIEAGESPEIALLREIREELSVDIEIGRIWDVLFHTYPDFDLLMLIYHCRMLPGQTPRCTQVKAVAWIEPGDANCYAILEADAPLLTRLCREGLPVFPAREQTSTGSLD